MSKSEFQNEMSKLMGQLKGNLQKLSKDAGVFAKKGEKELVRASKIGKIQLDIMGLNVQKEKIYYDMGKKIASIRGKNGDANAILKSYSQKLRKIELEARNKKREIAAIKKGQSK